MTVMVTASLTVVPDIAGKIGRHKLFDVTGAASDDFYSLSFQDILCTLAHIAGKHHSHSHHLQDGSYAALAAASFRRGHLADTSHLSVNDIEYGIIGAMTEMVIYTSVSCWHCYFHGSNIEIFLKIRKSIIKICRFVKNYEGHETT